MSSSTLTVLVAANPRKRATKTFAGEAGAYTKVRDYDLIKFWLVRTFEVGSIKDLDMLLAAVAANPRAIVIRGVPKEPAPEWRPTLRRKALFDDAPLRWFCLDVDKLQAPCPFDLVNAPEDAVRYVLGLLPSYLGEAACRWQLSCSAGLGPPNELRMHLWFWLAEPLTGAQLKRLAAAWPIKVDGCTLERVQPIYIAAPVFIGGAVDPLPRRGGLLNHG